MSDYQVTQLGSPAAWNEQGKHFVDKDVETQYIGVSANGFAPGQETSIWHSHARLEEIYIAIAGAGQIAVDHEVVDLVPGTTVRVGQGVQRALRALPDGPGLQYLCVRAGGAPLKEVSGDSTRSEDPKPWS